MKLPVPARRIVYRWGFRVLRVVWMISRPQIEGVKCVITDGDKVLLVRHTYGRHRWDLPGGRIERQESPLAAAGREMHEELGLVEVAWAALGQLRVTVDRRRDTLHLFGAELRAPAIAIDRGELAAVRWFPRTELPGDLAPHVRTILDVGANGR